MKGKGNRLTYWLIGEDPYQREERSLHRLARRNGLQNPLKITQDLLIPKSSLKNKSLTRTTFLRCSSESPKRLRFASSDQLNQKCPMNINELESIVDSSPCKGKGLCSFKSGCIESSRSSSNSCPCVEKLCEVDDDFKNSPQNLIKICLTQGNGDKQYLNNLNNQKCTGIFEGACRSAPSSPRHSSIVLNSQKRGAQSTEEIDGCDATPLISRSITCID